MEGELALAYLPERRNSRTQRRQKAEGRSQLHELSVWLPQLIQTTGSGDLLPQLGRLVLQVGDFLLESGVDAFDITDQEQTNVNQSQIRPRVLPLVAE
jgi:hypothetical protein